MQFIQQKLGKDLGVKMLVILLAIVLTLTPLAGAVTPTDPYAEVIPADYYADDYVEAEPVEDDIDDYPEADLAAEYPEDSAEPETEVDLSQLPFAELVLLEPFASMEGVLLRPQFLTPDAAANLYVRVHTGIVGNAHNTLNATSSATAVPIIPGAGSFFLVNAPGWHTLYSWANGFHRIHTHFYVPADLVVADELNYMLLPIENNRRAPSFTAVAPASGTRHAYEQHAETGVVTLNAICDRFTPGGNWSVVPAQRDPITGERLPGQTWALGSDLAPWNPNNFNTPQFRNQIFCEDTGMLVGLHDPSRSLYQWTTHLEKWAFYDELTAHPVNGTNTYRFNAGFSPHNFAHIPEVDFFQNDFLVFTSTDLSDVDCWIEAGALVQDNGRPTLFTYTGTHGHEKSSQEGALALAYALAATPWGVEVLEDINVVLYLGVNGTGNYQMQRGTSQVLDANRTAPGRPAQRGTDGNRDFVIHYTQEVWQMHQVWLAFMAEVTVDGHEIGTNAYGADGWLTGAAMGDDHQIQLTATLDVDPRIVGLGSDMLQRNFDDGKDAGLRFGYYNVMIVNASVGNHFYGMWGGISMIFETRGQTSQNLMRRAYSTYVSYRSLVEYMRDYATEIHDTVAEVRADLIAGGRSYDPVDAANPNSLIVRDQQGGTVGAAHPRDNRMPSIPRWNVARGGQYTLATPNHQIALTRDVELISRPTGYIVPMEIDWVPHSNVAANPANDYAQAIADLRTLLANHGVEYYILKPGVSAPLQQFYVSPGTVVPRDAAFTTGLRGLTNVDFDVPVLFIPMDQVAGHIIAQLMTPDMRVAMREGATVSISWIQSLQTDGTNATGNGGTGGTRRIDNSRTLLNCPVTRDLPIFRLIEDDPREFMGVDQIAVRFEGAPTTIRRNQAVELNTIVAPINALFAPAHIAQDVTWSSSSPALASVDTNGLVTARATSGTVVITARTLCGAARASITLRLSA